MPTGGVAYGIPSQMLTSGVEALIKPVKRPEVVSTARLGTGVLLPVGDPPDEEVVDEGLQLGFVVSVANAQGSRRARAAKGRCMTSNRRASSAVCQSEEEEGVATSGRWAAAGWCGVLQFIVPWLRASPIHAGSN